MLSSYLDRQNSVATESNSAKSSNSVATKNGKKPASQLELLRDQLHDRLMREKEQKMVAMYERQQQRALKKVAKTFRHQIPENLSPKSVNKTSGGTEIGVKERPRQRAVLGGRHNALEPLNRASRPSLPRPTFPNNRYSSQIPLPDEDVKVKGSGSDRQGRKPLARPHLSRHPKLPAVGNTQQEATTVKQVKTENDTFVGRLEKKKQEILLQLQREQKSLENIQQQRKEVEQDVMSNSEWSVSSQRHPRRQSRKDSRHSSKPLSHSTQLVEESLPSDSHFENGMLESDSQQPFQQPVMPMSPRTILPSESTTTDLHFVPCSVCGRKFAADRVEKHVAICEKSQKKKRKTFDTAKMRVAGTELAGYNSHRKTSASIQKQEKKSNWRAAHGK